MKKYVKRTIEEKIFAALDQGLMVAILGARRTGKTTLLLRIKEVLEEKRGPKFVFYFSFDDPLLRAEVTSDFYFLKKQIELSLGEKLEKLKEPVFLLVDEAQKVPSVFELFKILYDTRREKVKIVLSGSASLGIQKKGAETLGGRIIYFYLYPFSIREVLGESFSLKLPSPSFFEILKDGVDLDFLLKRQALFYRKKETLEFILERMLLNGSLPEIFLTKDPKDRGRLFKSFVETYLEKDICALEEVGSLEDFSRLLKLLAFETGNILNYNQLASTLGLSFNTVKKYLSILLSSFVINRLNSYFPRIRKRLVKSPKFYFFDPGVANFLGRKESSESLSPQTAGKYFENILVKSFEAYNRNEPYSFDAFFWRDYAGHEVDLVLKFGKKVLGVEFAKSKEISSKKLRNFRHFFKNFPQAEGFFVYEGEVRKFKVEEKEILCLPWWLWW